MSASTDVYSLLFGFTPDQWTEINGLASSVTAIAAVVGVLLAAIAVFITRRSVLIDRRNYLDAQFLETLRVVVGFGAHADQFMSALEEEAENVDEDRPSERTRVRLAALYAEMQGAKLAIRRFEGTGLGRWDAARVFRGRMVNLGGAMRALELAHDLRYVAIQLECGALTEEQAGDWILRGTSTDALREAYVQGVCDYLGLKEGTPRRVAIGSAFRDSIALAVPAIDRGREEFSREIFDHAVTVAQECYDDAAHRMARWSVRVPSVKRGWT